MKKFNNPYISIFLSLLILTNSCVNPNDEVISGFEKTNLSITIKNHISIANKISEIVTKENDINFEVFNNDPIYFSYEENLEASLNHANLKNEAKIAELLFKLSQNMEEYFRSIDNVERISKTDLEGIIISEIERQYNINSISKASNIFNKVSCEETLNEANSNCEENYAISLALVVLSGFISFGWGTVNGYAGATAVMTKCYSDAGKAYTKCKENE